jgi:hypothetical protein
MKKKKPDPRNYIQNLSNNTSRINDLLQQFFIDAQTGNLYREVILKKLWLETVGEKIWRATLQISEKNGILFIKMKSSIAKSEVLIRKNELLDTFNKKFNKYGKIKKMVLI